MLVSYYKVQPGDSLQRIAQAYGVTLEGLAAASGLTTDAPLRPGQVLRVPIASTIPRAPSRADDAPRPVGPQSQTAIPQRAKALVPEGGQVFLVIDQSYGSARLPVVTRLLDNCGARASWFLTGEWAAGHRAAARELTARGDLIGNHTWSHRNLRELPPAQMRDEIVRGRDAIAQATGVRPAWLRPPFGQSNGYVAATARQLGQRIVTCTIDSLDWHSFGSERCLERIMRSGLDGAVISLHAGADHAPAVLEALLAQVRRLGYRTATVEALRQL